MHIQGDAFAELLKRWSDGDSSVASQVAPLVYDDLRKLARSYLRRERAGHTLQTTALVHEVFLRLQAQRSPHWQDRGQFLGAVAGLMRRILVDHARMRHAEKRGCAPEKCPLTSLPLAAPMRTAATMTALDEALADLARFDVQKAKVIELRFFMGLSVAEIARELDLSVRTVNREWTVAKAWLHNYIGE